MFVENAHTLAMIAHRIPVTKSAVQHVNPSHTPVIALDQPLFALAKQLQWTLAEFSEAQFVVMLGGLHIEMASFKMLGKWLSGSGWADVMCNAGVATARGSRVISVGKPCNSYTTLTPSDSCKPAYSDE